MFEQALPEEFAEEAYRPLPKKHTWQALGALAACLAVAAAVYFAVPRQSDFAATATEPTAEEAAPEAAEAPMLRTFDYSAKQESVEQSVTTESADTGAGVNYALPQAERKVILPPESATDVENFVACGRDEYSSYEETIFRADGVRYTVTVAAAEGTLADAIERAPSVLQSELGNSAEGAVDGIPAILRWSEGEAGQIFWLYDGSLYTLTMDSGASAESLTAMAEQVFVTEIE